MRGSRQPCPATLASAGCRSRPAAAPPALPEVGGEARPRLRAWRRCADGRGGARRAPPSAAARVAAMDSPPPTAVVLPRAPYPVLAASRLRAYAYVRGVCRSYCRSSPASPHAQDARCAPPSAATPPRLARSRGGRRGGIARASSTRRAQLASRGRIFWSIRRADVAGCRTFRCAGPWRKAHAARAGTCISARSGRGDARTWSALRSAEARVWYASGRTRAMWVRWPVQLRCVAVALLLAAVRAAPAGAAASEGRPLLLPGHHGSAEGAVVGLAGRRQPLGLGALERDVDQLIHRSFRPVVTLRLGNPRKLGPHGRYAPITHPTHSLVHVLGAVLTDVAARRRLQRSGRGRRRRGGEGRPRPGLRRVRGLLWQRAVALPWVARRPWVTGRQAADPRLRLRRWAPGLARMMDGDISPGALSGSRVGSLLLDANGDTVTTQRTVSIDAEGHRHERVTTTTRHPDGSSGACALPSLAASAAGGGPRQTVQTQEDEGAEAKSATVEAQRAGSFVPGTCTARLSTGDAPGEGGRGRAQAHSALVAMLAQCSRRRRCCSSCSCASASRSPCGGRARAASCAGCSSARCESRSDVPLCRRGHNGQTP
eukprot:scaffold1182_cov396-Prasinococcus_capsulatus_cf.AAC.18